MTTPRACSVARFACVAGVRVHAAVHRRSDQHGTACRQRRDRQQIVGEAVRQPRHCVRCRRGDHQQISAFRQPDVGDMRRQIAARRALPQIGIDRPTCHRLKRQRRDKTLRRLGHDHVHQRAQLRQLAGEIDGFVSGDAAGHAQHNPFIFEDSHSFKMSYNSFRRQSAAPL